MYVYYIIMLLNRQVLYYLLEYEYLPVQVYLVEYLMYASNSHTQSMEGMSQIVSTCQGRVIDLASMIGSRRRSTSEFGAITMDSR